MADVIDFAKRAMELNGDIAFMTCACGSEDGWQAVVVQGRDSPVIAGLVCNACQKETGICWGNVQS